MSACFDPDRGSSTVVERCRDEGCWPALRRPSFTVVASFELSLSLSSLHPHARPACRVSTAPRASACETRGLHQLSTLRPCSAPPGLLLARRLALLPSREQSAAYR